MKERTTRQLEKEVAIIRVEELCPFPFDLIKSALQPFYRGDSNPRIIWVQEEAENQGAWPHVMPRLMNTLKQMGIHLKGVDLEYVGREASDVPAVGIAKVHTAQSAAILNEAFEVRS